MKPLATNSMIQNRYLVVQMIGKGGMGEVYLAVDQRLGSAVALKRTMFQENQALGSAFEREAKILGRLRHPVLPKVIDHFVDNNDQYLVMEHISGEDLGKRLENSGKPFPLSWVMFWADQLLDALAYLHAHEPPIIHRDIKPENLKLTDDNHIVLLDFGLSKDFDSRLITEPTASGSVVGYSPYFASMEQVRGTGTDARSDIYSLSATLYQLLTNTMPIDSLTRADTMLGGAADPLVGISEVNAEVTPAISAVILKGMSVRMDDRHATASEMQKALRRAFNNQAPEITAETTLPSAGEAKTQIIQKVPTLQPEATAKMETPGAVPDSTERMPESATPTAVIPTAEVKQAGIKTEVIPDAASNEPEVEQPTQPKIAAATAAAVTAAANIPPPVPSTPVAVVAPPKKRSKAGLVIGSLLGLLLLGGIAAGGGWFAYTRYYLPSIAQETTPTPTPAPNASPTSMPETTGLANSDEGNSSIEVRDNPDNTSTNTERTSNPNEPRSTTTSKNPGKTSPQNPGQKPTQKPKGRDDRPNILQ